MHIIIFKANATEIHRIGDHLLYDSSKVMINDILLTDALRVEIKSDAGGLLYAMDVPKSDFSYGQEIDFDFLKRPNTDYGV
ncbi:hypothetical protein [Klebsiella pneumoniae]|uniref:hypothetical protein n=1 Tax=Klebsiella pneumoniae TaxID=573 RepID=UPI002033F372|nr:hypothetical protein [Klebsiella pneumoniae]MCM2137242.1 hypothetical protein [Klebsiella pneumoniae]